MSDSIQQTIIQFYTAFDNLDSSTMITCYHPDLQFEDPAFGPLDYYDTCMMWQMLCDAQKDKPFSVSYRNIVLDAPNASVIWEADYYFRTGNKVHNIITANFRFKDGLMVSHTDSFDLYKWSKMALGMKGVLIGWTPFFKTQLNKQTNTLLSKYKSKNELRK